MTRTASPSGTTRARDAWLRAVEHLLAKIERWAESEDWQVARLKPKELTEGGLGTYTVSDLRIRTPQGLLNVEVVARKVFGADGRVDLCAFPSLHRMLLIRDGRDWKVKTDAGIDWPKRWGKRTFLELAESLTKAL